MEIFILGSIEARLNGERISLDGAKQKTVLAALLLSRDHILPDYRLSGLLWGENPPATASSQIYTYVSRLRKYLGGEVSIVRKPPGYMMSIGRAVLDHEIFQRLARAGQLDLKNRQFRSASEHFRQALSLWRGPALANVSEFLAEAELPRLEEARMTAIEDRVEARLALGEQLQVIPELTGLVAEYPLRERLRAQLMVALYRAGRQADALTVFHAGRRLLAEELGVDPGATLTDTHLAILANAPALDHTPGIEPVRGVERHTLRPRLLPPNVIDFAGRAAELSEVVAALTARDVAAPAAVEISGMPGVGKSALALRAAHAARDHFPDGQLYADLAPADGAPLAPGTVVLSFLRALGMTDKEIPAEFGERVRLYRTLTADRRVLVVLDHAENEAMLRPLLPSGQDCRTLFTARRDVASGVGARTVRLETLDDEGSLAMLTRIVGDERVAAEPEAAQRIAALCGGLPLALRVAGTRLCTKPHWPLETMVRRLEWSRSRLDVLRHGSLDVRTRIESGFLELDGQARDTFALLGLLDDPDFTAPAASRVLSLSEAESEEILETLLDARMLQVSACAKTGHFRYRFHELFRLFAREQATGRTLDDIIGADGEPLTARC
ncbi:AfsR/SARP family transcriptional regulator [Actinomadura sp. KC06]|uniref:AfsR/SARP family transcriptional regulator n=1 Tax=Actinomadura sp. KC06 TaxID=2530369 RepID=UPI0014047EFE|nr:AfsR/SARP family transcriptional regulator [Actinomadura sp. KC06]